jgi:hypothetical protein
MALIYPYFLPCKAKPQFIEMSNIESELQRTEHE